MEGDKTSLINDIEDEEVVDFNLEEEDIQEEGSVDDSKINKNIFTVDSLFIVVYEEDDTIMDKLLIVQKEVEESNMVHLKDENENDEFLSFDVNDNLILNNQSYSILDIEKVEEFFPRRGGRRRRRRQLKDADAPRAAARGARYDGETDAWGRRRR